MSVCLRLVALLIGFRKVNKTNQNYIEQCLQYYDMNMVDAQSQIFC